MNLNHTLKPPIFLILIIVYGVHFKFLNDKTELKGVSYVLKVNTLKAKIIPFITNYLDVNNLLFKG